MAICYAVESYFNSSTGATKVWVFEKITWLKHTERIIVCVHFEQIFNVQSKMSYLSTLRKFTAVAVGSGVGVSIYLYSNRANQALVHNSWTTNTVVPPEAKWDFNWDQYVSAHAHTLPQNQRSFFFFNFSPLIIFVFVLQPWSGQFGAAVEIERHPRTRK